MKKFKDIRIWDKIYNNPRADKQDKNMDDDAIKDTKDKMLYDETRENADIVKRMIRSYNKNKNKIKNKPDRPEVSQSEKRRRKLIDHIT